MAKILGNIHVNGTDVYAVWRAPLSAQTPTGTAGTPMPNGWDEFGYITDDGYTKASGQQSTTKYDMAGRTIGILRNQFEDSFQCTAYEDNKVVQSLENPFGSVSTTAGSAEVQTVTISGSPTGGTFTLLLPGYGSATSAIAYNAAQAAVQSALITATGVSGITVTASSAGGPYTVNFPASLGNAPTLLAGNGLTGGTNPSIGVVTATPGVNPVTTIGYKRSGARNLQQFAFDAGNNSVKHRYLIPVGEAEISGDVLFKNDEYTTRQVTVHCYPDASGNSYYDLTDSAALAAS